MSVNETDYNALLQEIQNSTTSTFTILPSDEPRFIINANTRKIEIPVEFSFLSVQHDHKAETIWFEIDRYFDGEDLSKHTCVVQFINKGSLGVEDGTYPVTKMDLESVEDKIIFGWEIGNDATQLVGDITFSIRFYSINSEGYFTYNFNTRPATSNILATLNVAYDGDNKKITPSELEKIIAEITSLKNKILSLEEYINNLQQGEVMLVQPMLTAKIYDDEAGE